MYTLPGDPNPQPTHSDLVVLHEPAPRSDLLDLGRPAPELDELRVAKQPLDDVLFHVPVTGEDVDRLLTHVGRHLGHIELPYARVGRRSVAALSCPDIAEDDLAAVGERRIHAREAALNELVVTDRLASLLALACVADRDVEGPLHDPVRDRRQADALAGQARLDVGPL